MGFNQIRYQWERFPRNVSFELVASALRRGACRKAAYAGCVEKWACSTGE